MKLTDRLARRESSEPGRPAAGPSDPARRPPLSVVVDLPDAAAPPSAPTVPRHRHHDHYASIKQSLHSALLDALGPTLYDPNLAEDVLGERVRSTLTTLFDNTDTLIGQGDREQITREICDEILGYGPLEPYLRDPEITEIMVNGPDRIYVERDGKLTPAPASFTDDNHLRRTIDKIVARIGRRVDEASPMVDARLPDGSRVNAIIPPVAIDGAMLTVRKFAADPYTVTDLVGFGTMNSQVAHLLAACVRGRLNILISGGTGSGKTTTLNVLSGFIPEDERVITIEDAAELQLHQEHVLRLEARPPNIEGKGEVRIRDLVRNALRMRPDRIVVGEIRDAAALDMLQAMNTGHDGSVGTVHANGPRDVLSRVETMVLMAGVELPIRAIREQLASAVDLIVHQARFKDGTRRVTHVTEVAGMEGDIITLQDLFVFDHQMGIDEHGRTLGTLKSTGLRPKFIDKLEAAGVRLDPGTFAFERFGR